MNPKILKNFENPGNEFRGAPFWAWNGDLDPSELRRQIRLMHRMGLGGFFMHSRVGLATPYLSDRWFECVRACVDEAEKLGMRAWLYDEDRWPSGAAGGFVTQNMEYRSRSLVLEVHSDPVRAAALDDHLGTWMGRVDGAAVESLSRVTDLRGADPPRGFRLLSFREKIMDPSSWYNGFTYLDTLNHDAVRAFIRVTHEAYKKEIGSAFGGTVPGIFTDEPTLFQPEEGYVSVPWTHRLPHVFKERYGYDILDHLPELFFDIAGQDVSRARYHYYDCITHLFIDAFARQIGEWCETNGILFTGHALEEDTPSRQTLRAGSVMRFYEHMQAPGMDLLTERWRIYDTAKQLSSAANQFGRRWRLSETYGCTGWDFGFIGHKALGDWQIALGVNLRCQHLAWYTMEGEAKRDYPAGIFYQSPWWDAYHAVEDYFARVNAVMTAGKEVRDILVIHPVESSWLLKRIDFQSRPETAALDEGMIKVRDTLLGNHLDFDYGDEDILARYGGTGKRSGAPSIIVNKAAYKVVVVPPMLTIRGSTIDLLERFMHIGGSVVFVGAPPRFMDASPSERPEALARSSVSVPGSCSGLADSVGLRGRRISITDPKGREIPSSLYLLREDTGAYYLFVVNTGHSLKQLRTAAYSDVMVRDRRAAYPEVTIAGFADCAGAPMELEPETGSVFSAKAAKRKSGWEIGTSLPAQGSRLFVIPKKASGKTFPKRAAPPVRKEIPLGKARWPVRLGDPNVLVLDTPRFRRRNGAWRGPEEILKVDYLIRDDIHIQRRGGSMIQPWALPHARKPRHEPIELEYRFYAHTVPGGEVLFALERPELYVAELNGRRIETDMASGWWCDASLRTIPVNPLFFTRGENVLTLRCDYDETHPGLEIVYFLGDFGVRIDGKEVSLIDPVRMLRTGDWCEQGMPFYSGNVAYEAKVELSPRKGESVLLRVPRFLGTAARIWVNGTEAGLISWEPYEIEITRWVRMGDNDISIEILGHRRNSHGPLHHAEKWPAWTGPAQFVTEGIEWSDEYMVVPCGLMARPSIVLRG